MSGPMRIKPIEILLVEDNLGDVRLTEEALKESKLLLNVHVVGDGVEALAFLKRESNFSDAPHPDLIFLDLNLPRMDGHEFLSKIKDDPDFRRIPVVILTVSKSEEDVFKTYDRHANCYITKPVNMDQFEKVVKSVKDFWFTIVKLPPDAAR
jgi:CheY-like chemotaxis protein